MAYNKYRGISCRGLIGTVIDKKWCELKADRLLKDENAAIIMSWSFFVYNKYIHNTYFYDDTSALYLYKVLDTHPEFAPIMDRLYSPNPNNPGRIRSKAYVDLLNKSCRGRFTMSKWLARFLVDEAGMPASKVHHVGGGCNVDPSRINAHRRNGRRFLFSGKDWQRKNGPLVVEAFKKLHAKYPDVELYIAGPQTLPPEAAGVKGVNFLGLLSYDDLLEYFNMCDFFVMPSQFEAYGIVFPEALCFGLPCIGKNICAMPEFIQDGENGRLINNDDPDELADCMEHLLLDGKNYAARVQAMHEEYLHQYSWKSVAERIVKVMREDGF